MNETDIRNKLYEKLEKEYKEYIEDLKKTDPQNIINNAYQITIKEEMVAMFYPESDKYDFNEIKALYKTDKPLDELYQGWMDTDYGINSVLEDSVNDTLEQVLEYQKEKKKDRER